MIVFHTIIGKKDYLKLKIYHIFADNAYLLSSYNLNFVSYLYH